MQRTALSFMIDSKLWEALEKGSSFFLLNFLWLAASVPLITFFPATAALFKVVRSWQRTDEYQFFPLYLQFLKEQFRSTFFLGLLWLALGAFVIINYRSISAMPQAGQVIFYTVNTFIAFVYSAVTVYLFPIMAHYQLKPIMSLKVAMVLSHQNLATTFGCLAIISFVVVLTLIVPITLLVTGSVAAYLLYQLCDRTFPETGTFPVQP